jgi:predicted nucleic acid-binding protein
VIRFVVDASIGIKWVLHEADSEKALMLVSERIERIVPDLFFSEIGNVLWKNIRSERLFITQADHALRRLSNIRLTVVNVSGLMQTALDIAHRYDRSFYDSAYIALAVHEKVQMVTADTRLMNALSNTPLAQFVTRIDVLNLKPRIAPKAQPK